MAVVLVVRSRLPGQVALGRQNMPCTGLALTIRPNCNSYNLQVFQPMLGTYEVCPNLVSGADIH